MPEPRTVVRVQYRAPSAQFRVPRFTSKITLRGTSGRSAIRAAARSPARTSRRRSRAPSCARRRAGRRGVSPAATASRIACCSAGELRVLVGHDAIRDDDLAELLAARQPLERRARLARARTRCRPAGAAGPARKLARRPRRTPRRCPSSSPGSSTGSRTAAARRSHHRARRAAARHQPAAPPERAERLRPRRLADVSTTTSTPRLPVRARISLADVHAAMVERLVGAERARALELLVAARRHPVTCAPSSLRDLQRASATPPPIPQISTCSPAVTRARVTSMRHAVSVASVNAAASIGSASSRHRAHVRRRHHDVLGQRARKVLAEDAEADAERLLAGEAVLARAVADARVDRCTRSPDARRPSRRAPTASIDAHARRSRGSTAA